MFDLLTTIINSIYSYAPRLLQAIMIIVVGFIVGKSFGFLVYRGAERFVLAEALRKTSVGRAILRSGYSPGRFMGDVSRWIIYLATLLLALLALGVPRLNAFIDSFISYIPALVTGSIIFVVGVIFADWVGDTLSKGSESSNQLYGYVGNGAKIFLYFVVLTIALAQMKVDVTIIYIFAQALSWAIAIAVGIALGIGLGWAFKENIAELTRVFVVRKRRKR